MKNELMKLLNAQKNDLKIDELNRNRNEYPKQKENLLKEISDIEKTLEEIGADITEKKKNRLLIENEIKAEREALAKKDNRLLETKTNKEYTAVQHEIMQARERIDALETEDIELMTELDTLEAKKKETIKLSKEIKKANNKKVKDIQESFDSIESDIKKLEKNTERSLKDVGERTINIYKRLRKGKNGLAVSTVNPAKQSCQGCYKRLPPQKVQEIRKGNIIIFCENCGRILVWDEEQNQK
ncbi:zinc ribbon domain-containing protein [Candidatus Latescibacterota bacterium]